MLIAKKINFYLRNSITYFRLLQGIEIKKKMQGV